jgi:hypothetical protein
MQYAQLNEDGTYFKQCESGNILWDENNFCTAEALVKDGKADMFRVVTLLETPAPPFDPITQVAVRDGAELVNGQWQYKWRIDDLSQEQIAANIAAKNEALFRDIQTKTQQRLDTFAQTRFYSGILSLCTYATSANPKFKQEGQYGVEARDTTWAKLYEILAEVEAGTRPVPSSYDEIEPELPTLEWPV